MHFYALRLVQQEKKTSLRVFLEILSLCLENSQCMLYSIIYRGSILSTTSWIQKCTSSSRSLIGTGAEKQIRPSSNSFLIMLFILTFFNCCNQWIFRLETTQRVPISISKATNHLWQCLMCFTASRKGHLWTQCFLLISSTFYVTCRSSWWTSFISVSTHWRGAGVAIKGGFIKIILPCAFIDFSFILFDVKLSNTKQGESSEMALIAVYSNCSCYLHVMIVIKIKHNLCSILITVEWQTYWIKVAFASWVT